MSLEDTILYELMLACRKISGLTVENKDWNENMNMPIFAAKIKTLARKPKESTKEIDIGITDRRSEQTAYYLFEVKHSKVVNENQYKCLLDRELLQRLCKKSERIVTKSVIYMGEETVTKDGILYCNVENFLKTLYHDGLDTLLNDVKNRNQKEK